MCVVIVAVIVQSMILSELVRLRNDLRLAVSLYTLADHTYTVCHTHLTTALIATRNSPQGLLETTVVRAGNRSMMVMHLGTCIAVASQQVCLEI